MRSRWPVNASLGMVVGVIDQKPFGHGGSVETGVSRDQRQRRGLRMDFEGRRDLHGVVATQGMGSGQ